MPVANAGTTPDLVVPGELSIPVNAVAIGRTRSIGRTGKAVRSLNFSRLNTVSLRMIFRSSSVRGGLLTALLFSTYNLLQASSFVGSDNFSSTTNWDTSFYSQNGGSLVLNSGSASYNAANSTGDAGAAWLWTPGAAPFSSDWSVTLNVGNSAPILDSYANIGLTVRDSADPNNLGFSSRLDRAPVGGTGSTVAINWEADLEKAGGTTIFQSPTTATSGAVLLTYDSANHLLTAGFSGDSGTTWHSIASMNPVSDWGMTTSDSFLIALTGSSTNTTIANADGVSASVFNATASLTNVIVDSAPEPSATALSFAGMFALLARRRRTMEQC